MMKIDISEFETSRLYLRPITLDMADGYKKYFVDYEVIRHLSAVVPWPYPDNGVVEFLQNVILPPQGIDRWTWGIFLKSNDTELIGCVDLWRKGTPENRGFWLGKPFWGNGYMTEAVEPVIEYAFNSLGFDKLLFSNALGNNRSRRIKEKTGARLNCTRDAKFVDSSLTSAETWELTKESWIQHKITKQDFQDQSVTLLKTFWFDELGCSEEDLQPNRITVVPHGTLKGYRGVKFFSYGDSCVISAPEELVLTLQTSTSGMKPCSCFTLEMVSSLIGERLDRIIGPAWIGKLDNSSYQKKHSEETNLLCDKDWESLENLLQSCTEEEGSYSGLRVRRSPTVGIFEHGKLIASAGYEILADKVAHIGVLVHPDYRGKGLSTKVVSGITEIALQNKLGIQYQTLSSNTLSVEAAKRVGFDVFAQTIAARLC